MTTPHDHLAALRDGAAWKQTRAERPVTLRLDSDGLGLTVELPGPALLGRAYIAPLLATRGMELFRARSGSALLTRPPGALSEPRPTDIARLSALVLEDLRTMPTRPDAGRPYNDLQLFVRTASPRTIGDYLNNAIGHARRNAPAWSPPRPAQEAQRSPRDPVEAAREWRDRNRAAALLTGREWLVTALSEGVLKPGQRILANELWALANADFGDFEGALEDDGSATRVPGRTSFYALADEALGPRRTVRGTLMYVVPG